MTELAAALGGHTFDALVAGAEAETGARVAPGVDAGFAAAWTTEETEPSAMRGGEQFPSD